MKPKNPLHKCSIVKFTKLNFFLFWSGFNVETVEHRSLKFTLWDVGGLQKLRPLWRHYYLNTQGW